MYTSKHRENYFTCKPYKLNHSYDTFFDKKKKTNRDRN